MSLPPHTWVRSVRFCLREGGQGGVVSKSVGSNADRKHVEVTESYFALSRTERRALLRRLLNGMSPNPNVRAEANEVEG